MAGMNKSSRSQNTLRPKPAAMVFAALGDPTRLKLVARLGDDGPMSITRLTQGTRVSRQAITTHLRVLQTARLVRSARHGREKLWELAGDELAQARGELETIAGQWDRRLARLKALVEDD